MKFFVHPQNDIQESAVTDKEGLAAAKQEIDFLRLSEFHPSLYVNLSLTAVNLIF